MNSLPFQVKVNGNPQAAFIRFATKAELRRYHRSVSTSFQRSAGAMREAVGFTRLAAKRWRYYAEAGDAAESLAELKRAVRTDESQEIAFILIATTELEDREIPIGLVYCRRTWCHHLAVDFLALHPRLLEGGFSVNGTGSGMIFGLVQLAKLLRITRI